MSRMGGLAGEDWSWSRKRWNDSWPMASSVGLELFDGLVPQLVG